MRGVLVCGVPYEVCRVLCAMLYGGRDVWLVCGLSYLGCGMRSVESGHQVVRPSAELLT